MMFLVLALLLNTAGMASLALSMERHHRAVFGRIPEKNERKFLRAAGWMALATGLVTSQAGWGFVFGMVLWTGLLTVALLVVALSLAGCSNGPRPPHRSQNAKSAGTSQDY